MDILDSGINLSDHCAVSLECLLPTQQFPASRVHTQHSNKHWRSYYGANGASAPPGPPRVTYTIRANPLSFFAGGGGLAIKMQLSAL